MSRDFSRPSGSYGATAMLSLTLTPAGDVSATSNCLSFHKKKFGNNNNNNFFFVCVCFPLASIENVVHYIHIKVSYPSSSSSGFLFWLVSLQSEPSLSARDNNSPFPSLFYAKIEREEREILEKDLSESFFLLALWYVKETKELSSSFLPSSSTWRIKKM